MSSDHRFLRPIFSSRPCNGELYSLFERNFNLVKKKWDEIDKRGTEQPADEGGKRMTAIETACARCGVRDLRGSDQ
jgi:hypothetical protein